MELEEAAKESKDEQEAARESEFEPSRFITRFKRHNVLIPSNFDRKAKSFSRSDVNCCQRG